MTGGYGKEPTVTVKAPWAIDKTRTKVLEASDGPAAKENQSVEVNYYGVNARTGEMFDESFSSGQPVAFNLGQVVPGFSKGLVGQKQGSRVVIAMPGEDGYDGSGRQPAGRNRTRRHADLRRRPGRRAAGRAARHQGGAEGRTCRPSARRTASPRSRFPKGDPPTTLQSQYLIKGNGTEVGENDTITFDYRWVRWSDGKVLEESYSTEPATASLTSLLPGMVNGLTGKPVGSRVLLVIPPEQGYPDGNPTPSVAPGETLVMVVDLLFTQA